MNHEDPVDLEHYDHHAVVDDDTRMEQFAAMRGCPVAHSEEHGGFWIAARYQDIVDVCLAPEVFASGDGVFLPDITEGVRTVSLEQDPPQHTGTRLLYAQMLSRPNIVAASPAIRAAARRHIEDLAEHGGDFVEAVAHKVPVEAIALMVGFSPEVAENVRVLTEQLWARLTGIGEPPPAGAASLGSVFLSELADRRDHPTDDFLTHLAHLGPDDVDGQPVNDRFLVAFLTGAMVAGHETTLNASANLAYLLSIDPALQDRLAREPELIAGAIDESLRYRAPILGFARTATQDASIHDVPVAEGDKVMVMFAAGNHDPERWDQPEVFDPDRNANAHLSFGWGIHRCIGASFAKIELGLIFEELLRYRIEPAGEPVLAAPSAGGAFLGVDRLPVRLLRR